MVLGPPGLIFTWTFLWDLLNIIVINLILSGDNAVLIAMAIRWLPPDLRKKGFMLGAGAAVVLRIALTFTIAQVLTIPFVKITGGTVLLWVAVKLFAQGFPGGEEKEAGTLLQAVWIMLIADLTMSLDNVIAVAGASGGNFPLLVLGLGTSIPFVIFTSGLLSMLMDRHPFIIYIGAAILGRVGAEMMVKDTLLARYIDQPVYALYGFEALCALGVIIAGRIYLKRLIAADRRSLDTKNKKGKQIGE
ncbi:MAG TPA: TerC family protein [Syntrophobacteraceae bacterium]|nr:TerC family protein [Syntrophobacteraceae bacterium]